MESPLRVAQKPRLTFLETQTLLKVVQDCNTLIASLEGLTDGSIWSFTEGLITSILLFSFMKTEKENYGSLGMELRSCDIHTNGIGLRNILLAKLENL